MITLSRAIKRLGADTAAIETLRKEYKQRRLKMREKLQDEAAGRGQHRRSRSRRKADKGHSAVSERKKK